MPVTKNERTGKFKKTVPEWSLENFDAGYVSNRGRFLVKLPSHPRSYKNGYILRSLVAYEAYHCVKVEKDERVHHINGDKMDDSKENLQLVTPSEHRKIHARKRGAYVKRVCENCGKEFEITRGKLKDKSGGTKKRGRFCSQECYHAFPRSQESNNKHSKHKKRFWKNIDEKTRKEISRKMKQAWRKRKENVKHAS